MRSVAVLLLAFAVVVAAQPAPTTPIPAGQNGSDGMCLLDGLSMTGGFSIVGAFSQSKFQYTCSCLDWNAVGAGAVVVDLVDSGSTAQVWFNGQAINTRVKGNGLTGQGALTSSALASGSNPWKVGNNLIQIKVNCEVAADGVEHCEYLYEIVCNKPPSGGGLIVGDPQFVGLRGQEYQVHGVDGEIYNIVSDADLQYNSRFVFLEQGKCPRIHGKKQKGCWSHPGSYLGELGLKTKAGDKIHVLAGAADDGFAQVDINGKELEIGDTVFLAGDMGSVTRNSTHLTSVQIGNWDFAFENSDMFVNQRVRVFDALKLRSHGLLGQTWRETTYPNAIKYIQGEVDDYVIRGDEGIFGDAFVYNAHN